MLSHITEQEKVPQQVQAAVQGALLIGAQSPVGPMVLCGHHMLGCCTEPMSSPQKSITMAVVRV